jgi:hypothetical protein
MTDQLPIIQSALRAMLDLSRIDTPATAEAGHEIELTYNDEPTGWFVTVRGEYAASVKAWQLKTGNKFRMKEWKSRRDWKAQRQGPKLDKNAEPAPALLTDEDLEVGLRGAAVRVAALRGVVFGGQPFSFSEENVYELVRRHPPFADQILEASCEAANFMKTP